LMIICMFLTLYDFNFPVFVVQLTFVIQKKHQLFA